MEQTINKITTDNSQILDEHFMMEMFTEISNHVDPFNAYLEYMLSEKLSDQ